MKSLGERWEQGSEFHLPTFTDLVPGRLPWSLAWRLYGSGRHALCALLTWGRGRFGWRRVWVPSYYCQNVVQSLRSTGLEIDTYSDGPLDQGPDLGSADIGHGDVLIRMNYFGVRPIPRMDDLNRRLVAVVDDVTHDPWSPHSRTGDADWCIASLRKVLPLPEGGGVWSSTGRELPPPSTVTPECRAASLEKLAAMLMKGLYLAGAQVEKQTFRKLSMDSESRIGVGTPSGMPSWTASLLSALPIQSWRAQRRANHQVLAQNLSEVSWLTLLPPSPDQDACPFSAVLLFPTNELRDDVRQKLIAHSVFPAIVWPLDEARLGATPERHLDFSRRMISIHCDMRYSEQDMLSVATLIRSAGEEP